MQLRLKGFVGIETLISNVDGVVAPVGELSTLSRTYSKDVGVYPSISDPAYTYYSFLCSFADASKTTVPALLQGQIIAMAKWIYQKQIINGAPSDRIEFLEDLIEQFDTGITGLNCGEMIQIDTNFFFPAWITFRKTDMPALDPAEDNIVTVWFADAAFKAQYDEFSITVVPPLTPLELFFNGKTAVLAALAARSLTETMLKVQEAKEGYPESILSAENFDYVDPVSGSRHPTNWTMLIYGAEGDDIDAIRDAIRAYIADNSARPEADWREIFPDIYKNTEFVVYPRWKLWGIPDMQLYEGTHSPIIQLKKELDYLKVVQAGLPPLHIDAHGAVIPCNYKSLSLLLISSPDNRDNLFDISQVYPDIINVPTSDTLFAAMNAETRDWILGIQEMLMIAETVGTYTDMPPGFRKVARTGVIYVTKKFKNINYLVASKATTPDYT